MTAEEKLDIIKVNIKHLVDYYDDNNIMDKFLIMFGNIFLKLKNIQNKSYE